MSQLEKEIENKVTKWVKKRGGLSIKVAPVSFSGLPDRLFLLPNRVFEFMEFKRPGEKPTLIQLYCHRTFAKLGFRVHVVDDYADAISILEAARVSAASNTHDDATRSGGTISGSGPGEDQHMS
jgi:hypothetical protein